MTDADLLARRQDRIERDQTEVQTRVCLMCGTKFLSAWKGNRICRRCKRLESDYSVERQENRPKTQHVTAANSREERNQEIISLRRRGVPAKIIAEKFKMGISTVRDIVRPK